MNDPTDLQKIFFEELDRRIKDQHMNLNERLVVKDRWIETQVKDLEKQFFAHVARLDQVIKDDKENLRFQITTFADTTTKASERQLETVTALATKFEQHFTAIENRITRSSEYFRERIDQDQKRQDDAFLSFVAAHEKTHITSKESLVELKQTVQRGLEELQSSIERLKEERGLFASRDSFDTKFETLEKQYDLLREQYRENLETTTKQTRESLDTKINTNADKVTKLEQNLQVMNARNQQSIIALGILLTLIELVIRFYQG